MQSTFRKLVYATFSALMAVSFLGGPLYASAQTADTAQLSGINTVINGVDFSKLTAEQISAYVGSLTPEQLGGFIGQLDPSALTVFLGSLPAGAVNNIVATLPSEAVEQFYNFLPPEGQTFLISALTDEAALEKIGFTPEDRATFLEASELLADAQATEDPVLIALALSNLAQQPGGEFAADLLDGTLASLSAEDANLLFFLADGNTLDTLVAYASEDTLNDLGEVFEPLVWASMLSEANEELFDGLVNSFSAEDMAEILPLMYDGDDIALIVEGYEGLAELLDMAALLESLPDYVVAEVLLELEDGELLSSALAALGLENALDYLDNLGDEGDLVFLVSGLDDEALAELAADEDFAALLEADPELAEEISTLIEEELSSEEGAGEGEDGAEEGEDGAEDGEDGAEDGEDGAEDGAGEGEDGAGEGEDGAEDGEGSGG